MITREGLHVIDTYRKHPRTLREAYPLDYRESAIGISGPPVIRLYTPPWVRAWRSTYRLREFVSVWWAYRKHHSTAYAARIAYGIAFKNLPF